MYCPNCHREIDDVHYCPYCGYQINVCSRCHQPLIKDAKYCSYCGEPVESSQESIGGYYIPIDDIESNSEQSSQQSFRDIPVNKHVNKRILIASILALIIATGVSIAYLREEGPSIISTDNAFQKEALSIQGDNTSSAIVSNINQNGNVFLTSDRVYLCDDNGYLVSMKRDFTDQKILINESVSNIYVVDETIYYLNSQNELCSCEMDGSNSKVVLNQAMYYVNIIGDKVYYQQDKDQERLYVYDLKTNQNQALNQRRTYNINVVDDMIYYTSTDGIYRIGIDGQNEEKLVDEQCYGVVYQEGVLYYSSSDYQIKAYHIDNQSVETLVSERSQLCSLNDKYLFYKTTSGLSRYDLQTHEQSDVYQGSFVSCEVVGEQLIVKSGTSQSSYGIVMNQDGSQQQRLFVSQDSDVI